MPDDKWPTTPIPVGCESVKTCPYDETSKKLEYLSNLKGRAGQGWKIHHKKKGGPSVLIKVRDD